jgi:hypothetical protein
MLAIVAVKRITSAFSNIKNLKIIGLRELAASIETIMMK